MVIVVEYGDTHLCKFCTLKAFAAMKNVLGVLEHFAGHMKTGDYYFCHRG